MDCFKFEVECIERPDVEKCKGLFFRGYRNIYSQGVEVHMKQGFRLLRRMSCTGCPKCDHFSDVMNEQLESDCVIYPDHIVDGGLYTIKVTNVSIDYWSGYADSYDYEFCEVTDV